MRKHREMGAGEQDDGRSRLEKARHWARGEGGRRPERKRGGCGIPGVPAWARQVLLLVVCVGCATWSAADNPFGDDPNEPSFPPGLESDPPAQQNLAAVPARSIPDLQPLLAIRDALTRPDNILRGDPPITAFDTWTDDGDPCKETANWARITCTPTAPYRVIGLNLAFSGFRGPIPSDIGLLNYLKSLTLDLNKFNGTLPDALSSLTALKELDIEFNQISGPLPDWISHLQALKSLKAASNRLNGTIPDVLSHLTDLTYLDLSSNAFTGVVPVLTQLFNLEHLLLTNNQLEGTLPDWLDMLPRLTEVSLRRNHLTGSIPDYQAALSLEDLYLGYNNLTGSLPDTIGNLTSLSTLFLSSNKLEGSIPVSFSNMSSLYLLDLSSNTKMTGPIPEFLANLEGLGLLQLTGCSFTGSIPASLGFLTNLKEMYLDDNLLVGSIPEEIGNISVLTQLYLGGNRLNGTIPDSLCQLEDVVNIDLGGNELTGSIPECLVKLPKLKSLTLSNNLLSGTLPVPPDPDLRFYYDKNCFANEPDQLETCSPNTWDSSDAKGGGSTADGGDDTPALPDTPPGQPPPVAAEDPLLGITEAAANAKPEGGGFPLWASVLLVIMSFFFLGFLAYTFSYSIRSIAKSVVNRQDQLPVQEFSLSKIKKATKNFTTVYGRGSFGTVYLGEEFRKGHSEPRVIIKRAADPQKLGDFLFKCKVEVLARARHRYLVNLLGYCTGRGERILVYEYLPNGTLFDRLHRPELEPLAWDVRVRIAVSIACALEHLHHGLSPPLVHRAVTSSNILLAHDMTAKLSDFGIARGSMGTSGSLDDTPRRRKARGGGPGSKGGAQGSQEHSTTQGILQLEKVDVYGFGVVVLELITGQKAMKEVHITSVAAPFLEDPQMMPLMVDPQLGGYFNQAELIELASIARDCTRDDPMVRPSMRDVLQCMEDRLRLDANLFENTDVGDDMLTDGYSQSSVTLGNPPHMRQGSMGSGSGAASWATFESLANSVKSIVSPGHRLQMGGHGSQEDFEMSSLLVMSGAGSPANDGLSASSRLSR